MPAPTQQSGFTLIELVITMVLMGILAGILAPVIESSARTFAADSARASLIQKGRLALERIAREVREAVPNTLRKPLGGEGIEFLKIRQGGRYIDRLDNFGAAFQAAGRDWRFDSGVPLNNLFVMGTALAVNPNNTDRLIIYNTSPADIDNGVSFATLNSVTATTPADGTNAGRVLVFAAPKIFARGSPGRHFYTSGEMLEIGQAGTNILWHQPNGLADYNNAVNWGAGDPVLVNGVTVVTFDVNPAAAGDVEVLGISLSLGENGETIDLYQEVQLRNSM